MIKGTDDNKSNFIVHTINLLSLIIMILSFVILHISYKKNLYSLVYIKSSRSYKLFKRSEVSFLILS